MMREEEMGMDLNSNPNQTRGMALQSTCTELRLPNHI